jgi:hypothetical protein
MESIRLIQSCESCFQKLGNLFISLKKKTQFVHFHSELQVTDSASLKFIRFQ